MHKYTRRTYTLFGGFILGICACSLLFAFPGFAEVEEENWDEIWLEPAYQDANAEIGDWGVANLSELKQTHFSFHVPHNFDENKKEDTETIIALIGVQSGEFKYKINISFSENEMVQKKVSGQFRGIDFRYER
jgi:hypothetical protein